MKAFVFSIIIALVTISFVSIGHSQGSISTNLPPPTGTAPLLLIINGSGSVSPFVAGQPLQIGTNYSMEAIPDAGYAFSSWQPVDVAVDTTYVFNGTAFIVSSVTTNISPELNYSYDPVLNFTVFPTVEIEGFEETIEDSFGWQVNFEQVPEPSDLALLMCGLPMIVFTRYRNSLRFIFIRRISQIC